MTSTHLSLQFHIIFSTKNRIPWICKSWRDRLHQYLGGIIRRMRGVPIEVGGVEDHVHVFAGLKATHALSEVLRDLKSRSSGWVHREIKLPSFDWQEGYGGFTVGSESIEPLRNYIRRQEEHHKTKTFQEEYVEFLRENGIEFNERYIW